MNQPLASARATGPKDTGEATEPLQMKESTYFWHPEHDAEIARAYVRSKYPGSRARVLSTLNTHRLHERSHVICLVRKRPSSTEKHTIEQGRRIATQVEPETLIREVSEGKPIAVKGYVRGATEWEDGFLDASALLEALAEYYTPAVAHYRKDDGKAHLYGA